MANTPAVKASAPGKKKPSTRIKTPTAKAPKKPKKKNDDSGEDSADEEKKKKEFKALDVEPSLEHEAHCVHLCDKGIKQSLYPPCGPNASTTNGGGKPKVTARRNVLRTSRTRRWREESRGMKKYIQFNYQLSVYKLNPPRIELRIELRTGGVKVDVDSRSILPAESVKNRHQNRPESAVDSSFDFPYWKNCHFLVGRRYVFGRWEVAGGREGSGR
ncbi:hypothetical protein B0H10DRAFT_2201737 [Mycena sp. CBHHK59/15]|nr:hypothetical protein B0H10DRAFT_2201737 [Mycena sp. CBHHK59/15]